MLIETDSSQKLQWSEGCVGIHWVRTGVAVTPWKEGRNFGGDFQRRCEMGDAIPTWPSCLTDLCSLSSWMGVAWRGCFFLRFPRASRDTLLVAALITVFAPSVLLSSVPSTVGLLRGHSIYNSISFLDSSFWGRGDVKEFQELSKVEFRFLYPHSTTLVTQRGLSFSWFQHPHL